MFSFFSDSIRELRHVVWPTAKETRKYFFVVVSILICFGVYLFIVSLIFSEILFGFKQFLNPGSVPHQNARPFDLNSISIRTGSVDESSSSSGKLNTSSSTNTSSLSGSQK